MFYSRKIFITAFLFLTFLTGCGSSSSSTDDNTKETEEMNEGTENSNNQDSDTSGSNMTGECVNLPAVKSGDVYTIRTKMLSSGTFVDVQIVAKNISNTEMTFDTSSSGGVTATGTKVESINIHDNYLDITKIVTKDTTSTRGITIDTDVTLEFSPYLRSVYTRACEGATWTNDYKLTTTTTILNQPTVVDTTIKNTSKVEAINESKTIGLGSYTTIKIKKENEDGSKEITWTDLNEAKLVYSESYDASGKLISTQELIQE